MEDDLNDIIADYFAGTLTPQKMQDFERRLAGDPNLADRVQLETELYATLRSQSAEKDLQANLQRISQKFDSPESLQTDSGELAPRKSRRWWWALIAGGVLITGSIILWRMSFEQKPSAVPKPNPLPAADLPPKDAPDKTQVPSKPKIMASAFEPLPALESYIGSQVRSADIHFNVTEPRSGVTLTLQSGKINFQLSGKVGGVIPEGATFRALIFSNSRQRFESLHPVYRHDLPIASSGAFSLANTIPLAPGLYYLLIEQQLSGEWVFVDKFFVK